MADRFSPAKAIGWSIAFVVLSSSSPASSPSASLPVTAGVGRVGLARRRRPVLLQSVAILLSTALFLAHGIRVLRLSPHDLLP
jgi:hypothetical protein